MLNLAVYTGCRFGDLVHAKWDNVIYEKTPAGVETVKIRLTLSKGDVFNRRDDVKIFKINTKDPLNPIHKLLSIYYEACSKTGFVLMHNPLKSDTLAQQIWFTTCKPRRENVDIKPNIQAIRPVML